MDVYSLNNALVKGPSLYINGTGKRKWLNIKRNQKAAYCLNKSKHSKLKKHEKYNHSGQLRYVVKYKVRKMGKSLFEHQCYCLMIFMRITKTAVCFQNKGHFSTPLWGLIGVLAKFQEYYFTNSSNKTIGIDFIHHFSLKIVYPSDIYDACWFPLKESIRLDDIEAKY